MKPLIISGVEANPEVLRGVLRGTAAGVEVEFINADGECVVAQPGAEVLFARPGGDLPDLAIMDMEMLLAVVEIPKYG